MGDLSDPAKLKDKLDQAGIELAAIAFVQLWNQPEESAQERREADAAIALLSSSPARYCARCKCRRGAIIWNSAA